MGRLRILAAFSSRRVLAGQGSGALAALALAAAAVLNPAPGEPARAAVEPGLMATQLDGPAQPGARQAASAEPGAGQAAPAQPGSGQTDEPGEKEPPFDPNAQQLLDAMSSTYQEFTSFSTTIEFVQTGARTSRTHTSFAFQKPNRLAASTSSGKSLRRVVSDGRRLYIFDSADRKHYFSLDAPAQQQVLLLEASQAGKANLGLLPFLLARVDPLVQVRPVLKSLKLGPHGKVEGIAVNTVVGNIAEVGGASGTITMAIGVKDYLLHRFTLTITAPARRATTITQTYLGGKVNPKLASSTFRFEPPAGARPLSGG